MTEIEKQPLTSMDVTKHQLQKLREIFPEVFSEGNEKPNWDKLRLTLGEDPDTGKERFGLNWHGKADCFKVIQQPSIATLVPAKEESIDFDNTQNVFIEGDNLEVLKLLQKSYLGKVKMIYIDPPYNTGKEFIYPDKYAENLQTYLEYTGQVDNEGRKFTTNTETDGRFHSKWLNMMYPRLFLAKNLLRDDGVIFISIDDNEQANLKLLCDEVFGEENFVGVIILQTATDNNASQISTEHEYIITYARNKEIQNKWELISEKSKFIINKYNNLKSIYSDNNEKIEFELKNWIKECVKKNIIDLNGISHYSYVDEIGVYYPGNSANTRPGGYDFNIIHPNTKKICAKPSNGYRWPEKTFLEANKRNDVYWGKDHTTVPKIKKRIETATELLKSIFYEDGRLSTSSFRQLMNGNFFENTKSITILKKLFQFSSNNIGDDLILDFFAGSCTTAQAVMEMNKEDGGNRKFICVQLPEPTTEDSEAFKAGYKTIAEISKERIRRVSKKLKEEDEKDKEKNLLFKSDKAPLDLGFKVFKLKPSNFRVWDGSIPKEPEAIQAALELHVSHLSPEAKQDAILFELLLKAGFELDTPIENLILENKDVYSISNGELLICLDKELNYEVIKAMAELKPTRVICLDEGFQNNDELKTNAVQIMKTKGVVNFRTV